MEPVYMWLILGAVLLIIEIFTPGFFAASVGIASLFTYGVAAVFPEMLLLHWIVFFVANFITLAVLRKMIYQYFMKNKKHKETNFQSLVGLESIVVESIDNDANVGYIKVYGDMWRASAENNEKIKKGEKIIVTRVEGNKVFVQKVS